MFFSLQILFKIFVILRKIQENIVIIIHMYLCKVLVIFVRFE
jgi:hypothetical protein